MMKPGGTGRPSLVISARPAPLPPRRFLFRPSASSKKYIGLTAAGALPKLLSSDIAGWCDLFLKGLKCCVYLQVIIIVVIVIIIIISILDCQEQELCVYILE